jgi:preprotein translocase SecF subunit
MADLKVEEGKEELEAHQIKEIFKKFMRDNLPELAPESFGEMQQIGKADVDALALENMTDDKRISSDFFKVTLSFLEPATTDAIAKAVNSMPFDDAIDPADKLEAMKVEAADSSGLVFNIVLRTARMQAFQDRNAAPSSIRSSLTGRLNEAELSLSDPFPREQSVGRSLSGDLQTMGIWAILLSSLAMLIYITFRFTFAFGVGAVVALIHDLAMTLGIIALLGVPITLDVLAAILTVLGYSLNDTIIVFDRIRENMKLLKRRDFVEVLNVSINQVLLRTVLTSGTTLLVIIALLVLAGNVLSGFAITLAVGIITGTYSSVFIATPIVAAYDEYRKNREAAAAKMANRD